MGDNFLDAANREPIRLTFVEAGRIADRAGEAQASPVSGAGLRTAPVIPFGALIGDRPSGGVTVASRRQE